MSDTGPTVVVFQGGDGDASAPLAHDIEDMVDRAEAMGGPAGEHIWIIFLVHRVADPDANPAMLTFDETTFLGLMSFVCLTCGRDYDPDIRHDQCDQSAPWERGETS